MGKAIKIISDALFITGLVIAGIFLAGHFTGKNFFNAYIVSSGSMEPAVRTGSVVIVAPQSAYKVTDIITYYAGQDKKSTTTHRIVAADNGSFRVAGDANEEPDPNLVPKEKIIGTVRFSVPFVGYLAASAKTPKGFILFVIVPATIIIYEELKALFFEFKKVKGKMDRPQIQLKPIIIVPVFFALLIPLTLSISYFIDRETSSGNSFTGTVPPPELLLRSSNEVEPTPTPEPTPEPTTEPSPQPTPPETPIINQTPTPTP
jgi:signal peptidase